MPKKSKGGSKYLGSAPLIVAQIWAKQSGTKIGTREFLEYARKQLYDGEYSKFKVHL